MTTVILVIALTATALALVLLVRLARERRGTRARQQWRTAPPSWGATYRESLAWDITHPKRDTNRGHGHVPGQNTDSDMSERTSGRVG